MSGGCVSIALLKPLARHLLPDDLSQIKFPVNIARPQLWIITCCVQGEFTSNKHGILIPARAVGTHLWIKFAELCGQREDLSEKRVNLVNLQHYYTISFRFWFYHVSGGQQWIGAWIWWRPAWVNFWVVQYGASLDRGWRGIEGKRWQSDWSRSRFVQIHHVILKPLMGLVSFPANNTL